MTANDYVLGLGSNLGSRQAHLQAGLALVQARAGCALTRVSPFYESDPVGPPQPRYLNAAARLQSALEPAQFLTALHAIERSLGRARERELRWGARPLDLDILWAASSSDGPAIVPHPRLTERWFALRPLLCVAPELEPIYGRSLAALTPEPLRVVPTAKAQLRERANVFELTCQSFETDHGEALAACLLTLSRALWAPGPPEGVVIPIAGECAQGLELSACLDAVLQCMQRGVRFHAATVAELGAGRFAAALLSASGSTRANTGRAISVADVTFDERAGALHVVLRY